jgi:hypothetical protein
VLSGKILFSICCWISDKLSGTLPDKLPDELSDMLTYKLSDWFSDVWLYAWVAFFSSVGMGKLIECLFYPKKSLDVLFSSLSLEFGVQFLFVYEYL